MRTRTLIPAVALSSALILAAGIAVGVSIPDAPQSRTAPAPAATPESDAACIEALSQLSAWARDASANTDLLVTFWERGNAYTPDARTHNVDALADRLAYIEATYVAECEK